VTASAVNPDSQGDVPEDSARHFASMEESLHIFAADPLVAKPGTKFNYSTYGYTLVGCVLEGAASQKYVTMYATMSSGRPAWTIPRPMIFSRSFHIARAGITKTNPVWSATPASWTPATSPGGGLISSADDMARFEAAILADKLVKRATRD